MDRRDDRRMDRRGFLARLACGAAAAGLGGPLRAGPALAPNEKGTGEKGTGEKDTAEKGTKEKGTEEKGSEEKGRWPLRLSTSTVEFSSLPVEKACEEIAKLGFEAVDFWHGGFGCPHLDEIEKRLGPEGLKDLLAKNKLKLYAISCYNVGYPRYAELLGKAGGGVAVRESKYGKAADLKVEMKAFIESLKPQLELAEKQNSFIAIENHGDALLSTLDSFKAFVDLNRHPRLGIALAPYHLQAAKIPVEEVVGIVGKQLLFFYAWQNGPGLKQLPGIGPADFTPWIAALARARYGRYLNVFMHDHPEPGAMSKALATSRDYLKTCYEKAVPPPGSKR